MKNTVNLVISKAKEIRERIKNKDETVFEFNGGRQNGTNKH